MTDLPDGAVAQPVSSIADRQIRVLARRDPVVASPGTSLAECLRAIQRSGVGDSVLVVESGGRLVGVLTERDIFGRLVDSDVDLSLPVEAFMTRDPRRLSLDSTVRDAITLMASGRYRNVPLLDDEDRVVGVIRQQDILRYLAEAFPEELLNLPPRPHQRMKEPEGA